MEQGRKQVDRGDAPLSGGTSVDLVRRARGGDERALADLFRRYLPVLRRWARGRLPAAARDLVDTEDMIQDTLIKTFRNVEAFDPRHDAALHVYLRRALDNRIRDEVRRIARRPGVGELDREPPDPGASPLEEAVGVEALSRYERALARLDEEERALVLARVEMDLDYAAVAASCGKPSPDAARMAVTRALVRLAREMGRD